MCDQPLHPEARGRSRGHRSRRISPPPPPRIWGKREGTKAGELQPFLIWSEEQSTLKEQRIKSHSRMEGSLTKGKVPRLPRRGRREPHTLICQQEKSLVQSFFTFLVSPANPQGEPTLLPRRHQGSREVPCCCCCCWKGLLSDSLFLGNVGVESSLDERKRFISKRQMGQGAKGPVLCFGINSTPPTLRNEGRTKL